jgi:hypothetical protein
VAEENVLPFTWEWINLCVFRFQQLRTNSGYRYVATRDPYRTDDQLLSTDSRLEIVLFNITPNIRKLLCVIAIAVHMIIQLPLSMVYELIHFVSGEI